ncbi:transposase [Oceanisphaera ostreae]|uniref:Transposase n=1 Tax=Oceanisphaera ostreae TaxID=914151 RepID=A0ABW3KFZ6_9GAMM
MNTKRMNRTYSQEFKQEAVEQGYSVAEAACSLGVNASLIYKWREVIEAQANGYALSVSEREELKCSLSRSGYYAWLKRPAKLMTGYELTLYRRAKALFHQSRQS